MKIQLKPRPLDPKSELKLESESNSLILHLITHLCRVTAIDVPSSWIVQYGTRKCPLA